MNLTNLMEQQNSNAKACMAGSHVDQIQKQMAVRAAVGSQHSWQLTFQKGVRGSLGCSVSWVTWVCLAHGTLSGCWLRMCMYTFQDECVFSKNDKVSVVNVPSPLHPPAQSVKGNALGVTKDFRVPEQGRDGAEVGAKCLA